MFLLYKKSNNHYKELFLNFIHKCFFFFKSVGRKWSCQTKKCRKLISTSFYPQTPSFFILWKFKKCLIFSFLHIFFIAQTKPTHFFNIFFNAYFLYNQISNVFINTKKNHFLNNKYYWNKYFLFKLFFGYFFFNFYAIKITISF